MKKSNKIIAIILSIIIFIPCGIALSKEACYQYSIHLIKNGEYKKAERFLYKFNDFYGYDSLFDYLYIDSGPYKPKNFYRNSKYLYLYSYAKYYYETDSFDNAYDYIMQIYDNYDGEFSSEIKSDKEVFKKAYKKYIDKKVEYYKSQPDFKFSYPYYAMYEGLINSTILGASDEHITKGNITTYYWYDNYGNTKATIICANGRVNKIIPYSMSKEGQATIKHNEEEYLKKRTKEQEMERIRKSYSNYDYNWSLDDPYEINTYDDPEDFYDDWYDDFDDYDDAEDYYYDHKN